MKKKPTVHPEILAALPPTAASPMAAPIRYRKEAMSRSADQGTGQIILATPLSFTVYASSAAGLTLSLGLVLGLCSHAVTEKVNAIIVPENGITTIRAEESGILVDYLANQGDKIVIGQPIAKFRRPDISLTDVFSNDVISENSPSQSTASPSDARSAANPSQTTITLVSQMDGTLYRFDKPLGEFSSNSEPIAMIARDGPLSVKLMVSEKARRSLRVGMQLPVTLESYKPRREQIIAGTVVFTANAPSQSTNYATMETTNQYQIVVRLDGKQTLSSRNEFLGRSVKAKIIVEKKKLYQWIFDPIGALFK